MVFVSKNWIDVPDEANPPTGAIATSAAELNRIETGISDAHAHMAESLLAHGGTVVYAAVSTAPPATPPVGLLWYQTDGVTRLLQNIGTSAAPVWQDVTRDKLIAADLVNDYVISGLLPAVPAPSSLSVTVPAGAAYITGRRVAVVDTAFTFAVSSDIYVDLSNDGAYTTATVANASAAPAITANSMRIFKAITDTSIAQVNTVNIATTLNATIYTVRINGVDITYTSSAAATAGEIALGLRDAINASVDVNVSVVTAASTALATDTTASFTITADTAGVPFTLTVDANLSAVTTTANNTAKITAINDLRDLTPTFKNYPDNTLRHLTADPAAPADNESWVRSDLTVPELRVRVAGATKIVGGPVPEAWHEVGAAGEPAFQNAWVNYGVGEAPVSFYKDANSIVHLRGLAKSGTIANGPTGAIFTLPVGYRPSLNEQIATIADGLFARCVVDYNGNVIAASGSNIWFSIGNIHFKAA